MVGFITGIAVVVILGQLSDLTGYDSELSGTVTSALDTLLHPGEWDMATAVTSAVTIILILIFNRIRRLKNFSMAIAMVLGTAGVLILGLDSVELVGDVNEISGSFPMPVLPDLSMMPQLALSAVAIGLIGLIQGSGVSQGIPNPDGEYPDASKDFSAQGIANVVSGTFQGLPLGGSLGLTAVIKSTGGRSRWANVFVGLFVLIFVIFFGNLVELVAMPTVAAILFVVGFQIIKPAQIADVWDVDVSKRIVMVVTFLLTLALPVQQAILIGVFLSFMDYIYSASKLVQLNELLATEGGMFMVEPPPAELPDNKITILHSRGSTYFAAARTLQDLMPPAKQAQNAVVIVRLRGNEAIGSTFILVLERYAAELRANGGRLMLSGVHQNVLNQLLRTETTESVPEDAIYMATNILGESTKAAMAAAQAWLDNKETANQINEMDTTASQEEEDAGT
jgi:SulP family sulfate permease